ncbi:Pectinesterase 1 [Abeliophyllum distichum]|uniref:Pectinesterase 1 n=1 Tax=Abeliophyllum distichum TaxID=126358 RepID=A0ABD1RX76_9LAMI
MESTNNKIKAGLVEEEDHLSSFRKRNNRLIIILFSLIILLGLVIGAITISFMHKQYTETSRLINSNPAIESFCTYTRFPFDCSDFLYSIIKPKSKINPNKLFLLSLKIAIEELTSITPLISNSESNETQIESVLKNCSSLLEESLSQLSQTLGIFQVNPDVMTHTDEQRSDTTKWTITAEQDLASCYDDLTKTESTAVSKISAKVYEAKVHVSNSADFLLNYRSVFVNFHLASTRRYSFDFRLGVGRITSGWNVENAFYIYMIGLQYLFLIVLFCSLYRIRRR